MSFSATFSGKATEIGAKLDAIAAAQKDNDAHYSPGVSNGHQAQIAKAKAAIERILESTPDADVGGSVYGHSNDAGECSSGGFQVRVSAVLPDFTIEEGTYADELPE